MAENAPVLGGMEALRKARSNAMIEGVRQEPVGAVILEAWARGEIDGDEARRRLDARLAAEQARGPGR